MRNQCRPIPTRVSTRSVTGEAIDDRYRQWNDHSNASARYRRAHREELTVHGVDRDDLHARRSQAQEQGDTRDEVAAETDHVADLHALVGDEQPPSPTTDITTE